MAWLPALRSLGCPLFVVLDRVALAIAMIAWAAAPATAQDPISFRESVAPVLLEHCVVCHGPQQSEGGLRLDTFQHLWEGGDSGPGVVAGDPQSSELLYRLIIDDDSLRMPLDAPPLDQAVVDDIAGWIEQGAVFDGQDRSASLVRIVPVKTHPESPATYAWPLPITALAWTPDGNRLLASGYHELTVWDAEQGTLQARLPGLPERIYAIAFGHGDGASNGWLAVAGGAPGKSGEVRLIDYPSAELRFVPIQAADIVVDLQLSADSQQLLAATCDGRALLVDLEQPLASVEITDHSDWVTAAEFTPARDTILTASRDRTAKAFEANQGQQLRTYREHDAELRGLVAVGEHHAVTIDQNGQAHRWDWRDASQHHKKQLSAPATALIESGEYVWIATADRRVHRLNANDLESSLVLDELADVPLAMAYDPASDRLAVGCQNGVIEIYHAESGQRIARFVAAPR